MDYGKLLLDDLGGGNVSVALSTHESPAVRPTPQNFLARRYGCDRKPNHHARARCMIQGRIDQLKLQFTRTINPAEKMKLQMKIATWQRKLSDEIRKSRFRKQD